MITLAGACIREYFVTRLSKPWTAFQILLFGIALIIGTISYTKTSDEDDNFEPVAHEHSHNTHLRLQRLNQLSHQK